MSVCSISKIVICSFDLKESHILIVFVPLKFVLQLTVEYQCQGYSNIHVQL